MAFSNTEAPYVELILSMSANEKHKMQNCNNCPNDQVNESIKCRTLTIIQMTKFFSQDYLFIYLIMFYQVVSYILSATFRADQP